MSGGASTKLAQQERTCGGPGSAPVSLPDLAWWYRYLAARPGLRELNFWLPSGGGRFGALSVGEPFFFKIDCHIGRPGPPRMLTTGR